jgi:outer membrane lipoprotein SlyB
MKKIALLLCATMAVFLTGCVVTPQYDAVRVSGGYTGYRAVTPYYASNPYEDHGTVIAVRMVSATEYTTSGAGAFGGAVVGGLIGNRFGGGNGKVLSTAAGVFLGAATGNVLEGQGRYHRLMQEVAIRKNNGQVVSIYQANPQPFQVGDQVSIQREGAGVRIYLL